MRTFPTSSGLSVAQCSRRGKWGIRGQWQPHTDCDGGSRRGAKSGRAPGFCRRRAPRVAVPHRPASIPAALCVGPSIVFTIAFGMIDVTGLRNIRRESPGEFYLAVVTAAAVVVIGVEQGILLAIPFRFLGTCATGL